MNSCVRSRSVSAQISQAKAAPHRVPSVRSTTIFQESTDPITAPTANTKMAAPGPPSPQRETMMVDAPAKSASSNTMATGGAPASEISDGRKRSEEHTSELQSLMRISYEVSYLK